LHVCIESPLIYPENHPKPRNLGDWDKLFVEPGSIIKDEYGVTLTPKEMMDIITDRHGSHDWDNCGDPPFLYSSWGEFWTSSHAMPGPNGLVRHIQDGQHCVGHGDGTWDLIIGDFS